MRRVRHLFGKREKARLYLGGILNGGSSIGGMCCIYGIGLPLAHLKSQALEGYRCTRVTTW